MMKGMWDGEGELNEEIEMELIEKRCVDLTKGTLQVSTSTSEKLLGSPMCVRIGESNSSLQLWSNGGM
jgi:hypothetical protein